jgi:hypothetical protein
VIAAASRQSSRRPSVRVRVTRRGEPVQGATVAVAGKRARTNARGKVTVKPVLDVAGSFAAVARKGRLEGRSLFLRLGPPPAAAASTSGLVPRR